MTTDPSTDMGAVLLQGVTKSFNGNRALNDLDVEAPRGRITVLLGPNGAGKTTAIRVITGAMPADEGRVRVLGLDPDVDGEAVRRRCGVVAAKPALYDRLSGWDNLAYSAALYEIPRGQHRERILGAAARFGIEQALDTQVGGYSTGMKTRLALARSVMHEPELLLFDEPTSGLDPESAQAVLRMIREMTDEGHTVVLCTHHLVEAEGLADHIVVLDDGTDLVAGAPSDLVRRFWPEDAVEIAVSDRSALAAVQALPGVRTMEPTATGARIMLDELAVIPDIVAALVQAGAKVERVVPHEPTLEELYFAVRGVASALGMASVGKVAP
jgi:ABC-2 type transport system ATP-binding protein